MRGSITQARECGDLSSFVHVRATLTFTGSAQKTAERLRDLGEVLQLDADSIGRKLASSSAPRPVDAAEYTALLSGRATQLRETLRNADAAFERASSADASPESLRGPFISVLSDIAAARVALDDVEPPASLRHSQAALQAFLGSLYHQIAAWPKKIGSASESAGGSEVGLELTAAADLAPFERAFAQESARP